MDELDNRERIPCPSCKEYVLADAEICPKCNYVIKYWKHQFRKLGRQAKTLGITIGVILLLLILIGSITQLKNM